MFVSFFPPAFGRSRIFGIYLKRGICVIFLSMETWRLLDEVYLQDLASLGLQLSELDAFDVRSLF